MTVTNSNDTSWLCACPNRTSDDEEQQSEESVHLLASTSTRVSEDDPVEQALLLLSEEEAIEESCIQLFSHFFRINGALQLVVVTILLACGIGSVIGLIPATLADRYARIDHGFGSDNNTSCLDYGKFAAKPIACRYGSDDAQAAATLSNLALNMMTLICGPVVGAVSDVHGRRPVIVVGLFFSCIPAAVYWLTLVRPTIDPFWYYASYGLIGVVHFLSNIFASMSDLVPPKYRAFGFGIILASYFGSVSLSPSISLWLRSPKYVACFSFLMNLAAFIFALIFLPETLSANVKRHNYEAVIRQQTATEDFSSNNAVELGPRRKLLNWLRFNITRPLREAAILNRNYATRLLAFGSFISSTVHASDATLIVYYVEEYLNVQQKDIAPMFLSLGIAGIVVQAGLLQPLIRCMGENRLLIVGFCCGTIHNFLYGAARSKSTIYIAFVVSQLTKTNVAVLSSLASQHVSANEQGRIQGALYAMNAIANAVGPLVMETVYRHTEKTQPGFMFIYASGLYFIGTLVVSFVPVKKADASSESESDRSSIQSQESQIPRLEQPLLEE